MGGWSHCNSRWRGGGEGAREESGEECAQPPELFRGTEAPLSDPSTMDPDSHTPSFSPHATSEPRASPRCPRHIAQTQAVTVLPGRRWQPLARVCQSFVRADTLQVSRAHFARKPQQERICTLVFFLH